MTRRKPDPMLRTQPWRITAVFSPLERILHRLEVDGTVETTGRMIVFREDGAGGWYDLVAALRGIIEFHDIASRRFRLLADTDAMTRFANKLEAGAPLFESDMRAVRNNIDSCKRQAMNLRVSQAVEIVQTIQISNELKRAAA